MMILVTAKNTKRYKAQYVFASLFFFSFLLANGQQVLSITDCNSGDPIPDIYILDEIQDNFLGYTNEKGEVSLHFDAENRKLHFKKLGALDTIIAVNSSLKRLCLESKINQLETFEVNGKIIPLNDQFESFIAKTIEVLPMEDDTFYYSFKYTIQLPDSGWKCCVSGIAMIPLKSYKNANSAAYRGRFCSLKVKVNRYFYRDKLFSELNTYLFSSFYLNYDLVRKKFSYRRRLMKYRRVRGKEIRNDSTVFFVYGYGRTVKYIYSSTATFDEDSIVSQITWAAQKYDTPKNFETQTPLATWDANVQYSLAKIIHIKHITVHIQAQLQNGATYQVDFETDMLEKKDWNYCDIPFVSPFMEGYLSEHPEIKVEFYPELK